MLRDKARYVGRSTRPRHHVGETHPPRRNASLTVCPIRPSDFGVFLARSTQLLTAAGFYSRPRASLILLVVYPLFTLIVSRGSKLACNPPRLAAQPISLISSIKSGSLSAQTSSPAIYTAVRSRRRAPCVAY